MINLETAESTSLVRERFGGSDSKGRDRCFLCLKPLDYPAASIHVCLHCNTILAKNERCSSGYDEDGEGGCGWFPVGRDCIKKLPREYWN